MSSTISPDLDQVEKIFQIPLGVLDALRQRLLAQNTEEALDQIDPSKHASECNGNVPEYDVSASAGLLHFVDVEMVRHHV